MKSISSSGQSQFRNKLEKSSIINLAVRFGSSISNASSRCCRSSSGGYQYSCTTVRKSEYDKRSLISLKIKIILFVIECLYTNLLHLFDLDLVF